MLSDIADKILQRARFDLKVKNAVLVMFAEIFALKRLFAPGVAISVGAGGVVFVIGVDELPLAVPEILCAENDLNGLRPGAALIELALSMMVLLRRTKEILPERQENLPFGSSFSLLC